MTILHRHTTFQPPDAATGDDEPGRRQRDKTADSDGICSDCGRRILAGDAIRGRLLGYPGQYRGIYVCGCIPTTAFSR